MFSNEKYITCISGTTGRKFFIRASGILTIRQNAALQLRIYYAGAEQGGLTFNVSGVNGGNAASLLMEQVVDFLDSPYTETVREFVPNGFTINGQA